MGDFLYMRPDENWALDGTVGGAGPVDSPEFQAAWLTDGATGRPVRSTGTGYVGTVTKAAGYVDLVAIFNHNVNVTVAVSGGVSGTIPAATKWPNDIFYGSFVQVTPNAAVTTLTITVAGNTRTVVIGELFAGRCRILFPASPPRDQQREDNDHALVDDSEFSSVQSEDRGFESRPVYSFSNYYTFAQFLDLQAWQKSQRSGNLPSLIIPDSAVNDAWAVYLAPLKYAKFTRDRWLVQLSFKEYPRSRHS